MRSRSSLLSHILGTHPQVIGYYELHRSYQGWADLWRMRTNVYLERVNRLQDKYLLDKILHNRYALSASVLDAQNARFIFLTREPETTLKSIINLSRITGEKEYQDVDQTLAYYCDRLALLSNYATRCAARGIFVESDDLIHHTEAVLRRLTDWLGLRTPLRPEYTVFKHTGQRWKGDPSPYISAGRVMRVAEPSGILVPDAVLETGRIAYAACRRCLQGALGPASSPTGRN